MDVLVKPIRRLISTAQGKAQEPIDTVSYRSWNWEHHHRCFFRPWAVTCAAYMGLLLRDLEGSYQRRMLFCMVAFTLSLTSLTYKALSPSTQPHVWARRAIISLSFLQVVVTWLIAFADGRPGKSLVFVCTWWLDTLTNLYVAVPLLAIADWSVGEWLLYVCLHISASTPFFVRWLDYSIPFAVFKVIFIHSLGLLVYICMERNQVVTYNLHCQQRQQRKQPGLDAESLKAVPFPAVKQAAMQGGVHNEGHITEQGSLKEAGQFTKQDSAFNVGQIADYGSTYCLGRAADQDARGPWNDAAPLHSIYDGGCNMVRCAPYPQRGQQAEQSGLSSCRPYISRRLRGKAHIKIDAHVSPEQFAADGAAEFLSLLRASMPDNTLMDAAVRYGCIVLSLDFCGLQPRAAAGGEEPRHHCINENLLASDVIVTWLQQNVPADQLEHGSVVRFQINHFAYEGRWNAGTQAWEIEGQGMKLCVDQCSMELSDMVFVLTPQARCSPNQQQQEVQKQQQQQLMQEVERQEQHANASSLTFTICVTGSVNSPVTGWPAPDASPPGRGRNSTACGAVHDRCGVVMNEEENGCNEGTNGSSFGRKSANVSQYDSIRGRSGDIGEQKAECPGAAGNRRLRSGDGGKGEGGELQLLAHTHGLFLPVQILEQRKVVSGQLSVQVRVHFPPDIVDLGNCWRLKLELVKGGSTVLCGCSALVLEHSLAALKPELQGMLTDPNALPQAATFVDDLAEFLAFQGLMSRRQGDPSCHSTPQDAGHNNACSSNPTGSKQCCNTTTDRGHKARSSSVPPHWSPLQQKTSPSRDVSAFWAAAFGGCGTAFGPQHEAPSSCIEGPRSQGHNQAHSQNHSCRGASLPGPSPQSLSQLDPTCLGRTARPAELDKQEEHLAPPRSHLPALRSMTDPSPRSDSEFQLTSDLPVPLVGSISSCSTSGTQSTLVATPLLPLPPPTSCPVPSITAPLPSMTALPNASGPLPSLPEPPPGIHAPLPSMDTDQSSVNAPLQGLKGPGHEQCTAAARPKLAHRASVGLGGCSSMNTDTSITPCVDSIGTAKSSANEGWSGTGASLLPALLAQEQQAKMAGVMAEVGLDLLHHALVKGLPALADQLMCSLLGAPFRLPFDSLMFGRLPAVLEHVWCTNAVPKQQQQQQQQQKTAASQCTAQTPADGAALKVSEANACSSHPSLLTSALLSGRSQMVCQVLQWGSKHGEGAEGAWEATDSSGLRPIQVLRHLPNRGILMQDLLVQLQGADTSVVTAVLHAQQQLADRGRSSAAGATHVQQPAQNSTFATAAARRILHCLAGLKIKKKCLALMGMSFSSLWGVMLLGLLPAILVYLLVDPHKGGS